MIDLVFAFSRSEEKEDLSSNSVGNGGVWGVGGGSETGRLGTPAFINVPNQEVLSEDEILEIFREIQIRNDEQVGTNKWMLIPHRTGL
jgi:hypothetical protein